MQVPRTSRWISNPPQGGSESQDDWTPGAPLLAITVTTTNTALVSWSSSSPDLTLQQNTNSVISVNWSNVSTTLTVNGSFKYILVNPPGGSRFYRLFKP